jgi:hypothetical protein
MADGRQSFLSILHLRSAERSNKNTLEFSVNVTPIQRLTRGGSNERRDFKYFVI